MAGTSAGACGKTSGIPTISSMAIFSIRLFPFEEVCLEQVEIAQTSDLELLEGRGGIAIGPDANSALVPVKDAPLFQGNTVHHESIVR
jgi:hypothetical protein